MDFKLGKIQYSFLKTTTAAGTLTLTATSPQFQIFTGTSTHIMKLPDATATNNGIGIAFTVINNSTGIITVQYNDASVLTTIPANASKDIILTDVSTSNGVWRIASFTGANGTGLLSASPGSTITTNYSVLSGDNGRTLPVDSSGGAVQITLPSPTAGFLVTVKDAFGNAATNNITIVRNSSELIDGSSVPVIISTNYTALSFISNGTNWSIISKF